VRIVVTLVCLLALAPVVRAQTPAALDAARAFDAARASDPARASDAARAYDARKKSVALAVTLEVLSPIAGMGAFYAHETEQGTILTIVSAVAAGAGVGAAFWLIHLDGQHPTGTDHVIQDLEQGTAISILATAAIVYLVARISGVALAPQATDEFNENLRQGLGVPPPEPVIPFHALAPGPMFSVRF
jgi:hypothetical protein